MIRGLVILVLGMTGILLYVYAAQRRMIYAVQRIEDAIHLDIPDAIHHVLPPDIDVVFIPATGAWDGTTMIFAHGSAEVIDDWFDRVEPITRAGIAVLLVEYPGYGRSKGRPSQESLTDAFVRGYDYLLSRPGVHPWKIFGYGRSLGGGVICALAQKRPLAGLALESTFTSLADMAKERYLPGFAVKDRFDNEATLQEYEGPVFIFHGTRDNTVPYHHALKLKKAAPQAILMNQRCEHGDCRRTWPSVVPFIKKAAARITPDQG